MKQTQRKSREEHDHCEMHDLFKKGLFYYFATRRGFSSKDRDMLNVIVCVMAGILVLVLLFVTLTGCSAQGETPYVPTGDGLTWDEDYTGPIPTKPQDTVQELTLTYYPDRSMNPYICTDFTNRGLFTLLYQSLFTVDRDYHVEPQLCKQYFVSEDMRTYTFYLEQATFSDGSVLTAQDVVASLLAARESTFYSGRFLHVKEVALSADGGVTVTLDTACEDLPVLLDIPILKQTQVAEDRPLGTGPYMLQTNALGDYLSRRNDWWCRAKMTVTAPSIALISAESPTQIRDEFQFGELGLVCADPGSDRYADYRCDYELWDCENGIFLYLACNMDSEVFSDPNVRTALTHAIDRDTLVEDYYRGFARSATLPASPLSPYYNETLAARFGYDGTVFAQAVNDAGMQEKPVVLLVNSDDSLRVRVARDMGQMLSDCGLAVEMKELGGSSYTKALRNKEYDVYLGQTKLSANMDLSAFFAGSGALSYGSINDVAMYTLCLESLANYGNYYTLHQRVMEDGRLVPILFRSYAVYATRGLLTGLTPARDSVFYYSLGKTMESARISG